MWVAFVRSVDVDGFSCEIGFTEFAGQVLP